jgi:hypothetical protein
MKTWYDEDLASHIAPEPCVVSREGPGEASAGDCAGWPLSRESAFSRTLTGLPTWKATRIAASTRVTVNGTRATGVDFVRLMLAEPNASPPPGVEGAEGAPAATLPLPLPA